MCSNLPIPLQRDAGCTVEETITMANNTTDSTASLDHVDALQTFTNNSRDSRHNNMGQLLVCVR